MSDYKNTLNLPTTSFPMKANLAEREPDWIKQWQTTELYEQIRSERQGKKRFILHDGPPYANGHLHCGHALNKILKDIIVKAKTLSGYDAPFVPGWDCHGLPIELNVEKKEGKAGVNITEKQFRTKCREYARSQIAIQRDEFQRLGVFGDWQHPYATYDYAYEANILRALAQIIENGHLQQGFKPVHWCVDCGSALAEAEVEYEEKVSTAIDVAFYVVEPERFLKRFSAPLPVKPVIIPIWTTTPWSLPGNEAVSLHSELSYQLLDRGGDYLLIARELVLNVTSRYQLSAYEIVGEALGETFFGAVLKHPFYERHVPLILAEHVTTEAGTGAVHIAPAHGPEDYEVGKAYNLPLVNPVMTTGCYGDDVPYFANTFVLKADEKIVALLKEKNTLLFQEKFYHSYPHCWRHKTPMIFLATPQWFIAMEKNNLRHTLLALIENVEWLPEWGKQRIIKMVATRPDWCISRQRAWGTPLPLFVHKETRALHPQTLTLLRKIAQQVEEKGIDAWFDSTLTDWLDAEDAKAYEKINDTLDVWFDSGVSHYAVLRGNKTLALPADMYLEGSDQHRGWFNSSLTTAAAIYGYAPYKTVLTHGYTVDAEGKKLSKSRGNYIALDKLIQKYGADILRLWVASTDYRNEVSISEEIIQRTSDAYRRIRNTARFLLANLFDFNPESDLLPPQKLVALDKWAIKRAEQLQNEIVAAYENYHFHVIYQKIHNFCAVDLSSFYLDIIKDRQYTLPKNSCARRSCQTAMYHIIQALTRWLAPILSFTAEEIWQAISKNKKSIFLEQWYENWPKIAGMDFKFWQDLQATRDEVNKALEAYRQQGLIGSSLAAEVILYVNPTLYTQFSPLKEELRFVLITSEAKIEPLSNKPHNLPMQEELDIAIAVRASDCEKCARCWHRQQDVGSHQKHPDLCGRCVLNLTGEEEKRCFA